jgi:hypothetical protein
MKHKHAFVGKDLEGDSCIYVIYTDFEGNTRKYLSEAALRKIANQINAGQINKEEKP